MGDDGQLVPPQPWLCPQAVTWLLLARHLHSGAKKKGGGGSKNSLETTKEKWVPLGPPDSIRINLAIKYIHMRVHLAVTKLRNVATMSK